VSSYAEKAKLESLVGSDETTIADARGSVVSSANVEGRWKEIEPVTPPGEEAKNQPREEDGEGEVNYPGPLGLFILITGIALSVFLISLDRTIITTVSSHNVERGEKEGGILI